MVDRKRSNRATAVSQGIITVVVVLKAGGQSLLVPVEREIVEMDEKDHRLSDRNDGTVIPTSAFETVLGLGDNHLGYGIRFRSELVTLGIVEVGIVLAFQKFRPLERTLVEID